MSSKHVATFLRISPRNEMLVLLYVKTQVEISLKLYSDVLTRTSP